MRSEVNNSDDWERHETTAASIRPEQCNDGFGHTRQDGPSFNQLVVQAEQFKAAVEQPKCMFTPNLDQFVLKQDLEQFLRTLVDNEDDEFFHLTCHVDLPLCQKIERGEFV